MFCDRIEAARLLAGRLAAYQGKNPLVLAIPRGAVPMGAVLAQSLGGELDVVLVHKLGAPHQPELAIGSVSESGDVYLDELVTKLAVPKTYIDEEVERELEALRQRRARYTPAGESLDPKDRLAIVLDDGVATGWTMIAALRAVRSRGPKKLVAAMAVAPPSALEQMASEADEVVCLATPESFLAVGQFFRDFRQVTDEEVVELLRKARKARSRPAPP